MDHIFYHYLAMRTWSTDFFASKALIDRTLMWVRIPHLNLVYYDESFLMALATVIGNVTPDIATTFKN
jgi:hypothetical protein